MNGDLQLKTTSLFQKDKKKDVINFYMPTQVIMGEDCVLKQGQVIKYLGAKAMIVTGTGSAKKNGSEEDVTKLLDSLQIDYIIYDKITSNPSVSSVYEGAKAARKEKVDFIIAIGGGSPMDAGKAIALLTVQDIKEEELFAKEYKTGALPIVCIPTTAGTGAEVTSNAVLTNDRARTKMSIKGPGLFPAIALLDAGYMQDLPLNITINTAIDVISHAIEGMLSIKASALTDTLAKSSISNIKECFPSLLSGRLALQEREKLLYGSMLAGMVIAHTGTTAVHSMGYLLTYFKGIDHGRANGLLLPSYLRFVKEKDRELVEKILDTFDYGSIDELDLMFTTLLGEKEPISEEEADKFSEIAVKSKNVLNCTAAPDQEEIKQLYLSALING